jgi:NDP-sugar pyrophosphorylase family protein
LRPLTQFLPKPLLPVAGKPVIAHTLDALARVGCERVAINLFHQGDKIAARLGSRYEGMDLVYSVESELMGTLGALALLAEFTGGAETTVVVNGDSLCRWPLRRILRYHQRSSSPATLLVSTRAPLEAFGGGVGLSESNSIVSFAPDESYGQVQRRLVFAGLHVLDSRLLAALERRPTDFVRDFYQPMLARGRGIDALETSRPWFDLGTPAAYLFGVCDWAQRRGPAKVAGRNWIAPDAAVDPGASLKRSVVEAGVKIEAGAEIVHSLLLPGARVEAGSVVRYSVIGFRARVPPGTVVERRLITSVRADLSPRPGDSVVGGLVYSPLG